MSPRRALLGIGLPIALALLGGGCETALDPIQVAATCPEAPLRGPDQWDSEPGDRLIDDFEDGDVTIAHVGGRTGAWALGLDGSPGNVVAEASSRCSARGGKAGHFAGSDFTDWGANWTAAFMATGDSLAVPYDGRPYGGISFWAAVGGEAREPSEVPVGVTTMDVAWNGGVCTTKCMDFYGTHVPLTHAWQRFAIRFADLAQGGWGSPQIAMKRDQLVGFILWPNDQFDIWIDDIRFDP